MKLLGALLMMLSTTSAGICYSEGLRGRVRICRELASLCELLEVDISTVRTSVPVLLDRLLGDDRFSSLGFLSSEAVLSGEGIQSGLDKGFNDAICDYFHSLGRYDAKSQLALTRSFIALAKRQEAEYEEIYKSKSRVGICLGASLGIVLSLVLI